MVQRLPRRTFYGIVLSATIGTILGLIGMVLALLEIIYGLVCDSDGAA